MCKQVLVLVKTVIFLGGIQNMDPGPWTTPVDPVHGPPCGPGPWTTPVDPVHRPPCGPGPWTTPVDQP